MARRLVALTEAQAANVFAALSRQQITFYRDDATNFINALTRGGGVATAYDHSGPGRASQYCNLIVRPASSDEGVRLYQSPGGYFASHLPLAMAREFMRGALEPLPGGGQLYFFSDSGMFHFEPALDADHVHLHIHADVRELDLGELIRG